MGTLQRKNTMRAIVRDRYGSPDVLRLTELAQPIAGDGEVQVRVRAAALNAYDWHFLRGDPYAARLSMGMHRPRVTIPGRDFAGEVTAVGPGVTGVAVGDEVYGEAGGALAEYLTVRAGQVTGKPANLTYEQAAAIPLAGNTALMGIRDAAAVQPGQSVLINGASGGVGPYAVQLAKHYGATVTGVCRTGNIDLVRSVGADEVVDYTRVDVTRSGERYDVVFDLVGNHRLAALRRLLRPGGVLVLSGGGVYSGGSLLGPMRLIVWASVAGRFGSDRVVVLSAVASQANLVTLRELAEAGQLTPVIDRSYPLSEVPAALHYLESEHARAKVVITV